MRINSFLFAVLLYIINALNSDHCIHKMGTIAQHSIGLPYASDISTANSIAIDKETDKIFIAGDIKSNDLTVDYSFVNVYNKDMILLNSTFWDTDIKSNVIHIGNHDIPLLENHVRSFTRVITHPKMDYYFVIGYNQIRGYNKTDYKLIWSLDTNTIESCYNDTKTNIVYSDAMFIINGMYIYNKYIYVPNGDI